MNRAYAYIGLLYQADATHRKGFRISETTPESIIEYLTDEAKELRDNPQDIDELFDVFACGLNFAKNRGLTMEEIEAGIIRKLRMRFAPAFDDATIDTFLSTESQ